MPSISRTTQDALLPPPGLSGLLVLTVGTGTAGKESNLAQGLVNTLDQIQPRSYWLVPSSSEASRTLADLVREDRPNTFREWSAQQLYRAIDEPDDLQTCQDTLREVIRSVRKELLPGERLILNPVSGTKQMSAGATLAAVAEGVGRLVFTVGDRQDGVVRTGTERLADFDIARFLALRDLDAAKGYFAAGAYDAAWRLLDPHTVSYPTILVARDTCRLMHQWQRGDWKNASGSAKRIQLGGNRSAIRRHLSLLAGGSATDDPAEILWSQFAEYIASCDMNLKWNEPEEALGRLYRAAEHLAKTLLFRHRGLKPPYARRDMESAFPSYTFNGEGSVVLLGLREAWRLVRIACSSGPTLEERTLLWDILQERNETWIGHGSGSADTHRVRQGRNLLMEIARGHQPDIGKHPAFTVRPSSESLQMEGI